MFIVLIKKKSKIHGFGIFTDNFISKDSVFYKIPLDKIYSKPKLGFAKIGEGKYVCDLKVLNFVNHSCEPNSKLDLKKKALVSLRDINSDEEITVDYCKTEINGVKVDCFCKSKKCKGYFLREE